MRLPAILATCLLLAGCGFVHKIDVQQGNYVTQDVVDKLATGMSRAQVRQVLGTPLLTDVFHANRWDYYFSNSKGGKDPERKRFSVFFEDDKVHSFTGSAHPPGPPPVGGTPPPRPPAGVAPPR
jgi:outer membrane protein assembly factor BamE